MDICERYYQLSKVGVKKIGKENNDYSPINDVIFARCLFGFKGW